jgi:hypothetical protein
VIVPRIALSSAAGARLDIWDLLGSGWRLPSPGAAGRSSGLPLRASRLS